MKNSSQKTTGLLSCLEGQTAIQSHLEPSSGWRAPCTHPKARSSSNPCSPPSGCALPHSAPGLAPCPGKHLPLQLPGLQNPSGCKDVQVLQDVAHLGKKNSEVPVTVSQVEVSGEQLHLQGLQPYWKESGTPLLSWEGWRQECSVGLGPSPPLCAPRCEVPAAFLHLLHSPGTSAPSSVCTNNVHI
jgi:hypothetical protein